MKTIDIIGASALGLESKAEVAEAFQAVARTPDGAFVLGHLLSVTGASRASEIVCKDDGSIDPNLLMIIQGRTSIGFYIQKMLEADTGAMREEIAKRKNEDDARRGESVFG